MSTEIRVALVYQQDEASKALRTALANAGVGIAIERRASDLDTAAILGSQVDAIVVNLDPELEDLLDDVAEALDNASQPVIFNDPAASSDLSGWDRARWLRHLSAKLKGRTDVTPPAPPGAQAIPSPAPKAPVAAVTVPESAAAIPAEAPASAPAAAPAPDPVESALELSLADLDAMFEAPEAAVAAPSTAAPASLTMGDDLGDLDAFFEQQVELVDLEATPAPEPAPAPPAPPATPAVTDIGDTIDLDALFSAPAPAASEPSVQMASEDELNDLDALFSQPPPADPEDARIAPVATSSELNDLDALFREFEASKAADAAPAAAPAPAPAPAAAAPKAAPSDWSLEPLDDLLAELPPATSEAAPKPAPAAPKTSSGPSIPAELEASLALADLKLVDDSVPVDTPAAAGDLGGLGDLESLDLSGLELEHLEPAGAAGSTADVGEELSLTDIDFDFDLGNSAASAPTPASASDADLGDLDSLFEPVAASAVSSLSLADLNRVFVLGASIGGPEAIKAFLARLPATVPAAFIVAQHMGSEFLEMMAAQLDAATALSVRYPKAGERLRHGEVIVAPANEHLTLDAEGRVQLSAAPSGSPYSPSIDQLARDAADRFGDHATLILFSGMGTDAVDGGRYLSSRGGQVWAQDRASCVIATMIDSAKSQGLLRFEGSPVQLAERVLELVS